MNTNMHRCSGDRKKINSLLLKLWIGFVGLYIIVFIFVGASAAKDQYKGTMEFCKALNANYTLNNETQQYDVYYDLFCMETTQSVWALQGSYENQNEADNAVSYVIGNFYTCCSNHGELEPEVCKKSPRLQAVYALMYAALPSWALAGLVAAAISYFLKRNKHTNLYTQHADMSELWSST